MWILKRLTVCTNVVSFSFTNYWGPTVLRAGLTARIAIRKTTLYEFMLEDRVEIEVKLT